MLFHKTIVYLLLTLKNDVLEFINATNLKPCILIKNVSHRSLQLSIEFREQQTKFQCIAHSKHRRDPQRFYLDALNSKADDKRFG